LLLLRIRGIYGHSLANGKFLALHRGTEKGEIMHFVLFSPILADVLGDPYGGIFLVILSAAALLRK
jgi:hypothetical protein